MLRDLFGDGAHSLSELLDASFRLYRLRFGKLVLISAIFAIISLVFEFPALLWPTSTAASLLTLGARISSFIVYLVLLVYVLSVLSDRESTIGQSINGAFGRFWSYLGMSILEVLAFTGILLPAALLSAVFFPLVFIVGPITLAVMVFIVVRWTVSGTTLVAEREGATFSLGRSWELTRGYFWRTCVYSILLALLSFVFLFIPSFFAGIAGALVPPQWLQFVAAGISIMSYVFTMFWTPFSVIAIVLYYFDLRVRKESFDLELRVQEIEDRSDKSPVLES